MHCIGQGSMASTGLLSVAEQTQQSMAAQGSFLVSLARPHPLNPLQALWKQVQVWAPSASSMTWPHWKRRSPLQRRLAPGCPISSVQVSCCDLRCILFSELIRP